MKRSTVFAALAGLAVGVATIRARRARAEKHAGLFELDAQFHAAYDRLRAVDARAAPVLVLFGDSLIAFEGERQKQWRATAPATQLIKATAHVPVAIFATLRNRPDPEAPFDSITAERLATMRRRLHERALGTLDELDDASRSDVERVLEASRGFLERILSRECASVEQLSDFAAAIGPLLLRLTEHATRLDLAALHAAADAAIGELDSQRRAELEVVVAGAHQARSRSLGLQYFQKRFDEGPGEERRVTYAEAAADAREARELIGTRRLDREIALAFFGDAKKLQRDVLGDAAARQLERADFGALQPSRAPQTPAKT